MLYRTKHEINTRDCLIVQTHCPMQDSAYYSRHHSSKNRYVFKLNELAHGHRNEVSWHPDHPS